MAPIYASTISGRHCTLVSSHFLRDLFDYVEDNCLTFGGSLVDVHESGEFPLSISAASISSA